MGGHALAAAFAIVVGGAGLVTGYAGDLNPVSAETFPQALGEIPGIGPAAVISLADLNGDGSLDLVGGTVRSDVLQIAFGDGLGSFVLQAELEFAGRIRSIDIVDLDNDSNKDLLVGFFLGNDPRVVWSRNAGGGLFEDAQAVVPAGLPIDKKLVTDIDGDGLEDLVVAMSGPQLGISSMKGAGGGVFGEPIPSSFVENVASMAAGDLDGDGFSDVAVLSSGPSPTVFILRGRPDGSLETPTSYDALGFFDTLLIADPNGDGAADVLLVGHPDIFDGVAVLPGRGDASFDSAVRIDVPHSVGFGAAIADLNQDGLPDLVTDARIGADVHVFMGHRDLMLKAGDAYSTGLGTTGPIAVGDIDGSGTLDVVIVDGSQARTVALLGRGDGSLVAGHVLPTDVASSAYAIADLDRDGWLDVVSVGEFARQGRVTILYGESKGSFRGPVVYPSSHRTTGVEIADADGDGLVDIVTSSFYDGSIGVMRGNGSGDFQSEVLSEAAPFPEEMGVVDLDGDGLPEVVTGSRSRAGLAIHSGGTDGYSGLARVIPLEFATIFFVARDLDLDTYTDLILTDEYGDRVAIMYGSGRGNFGEPVYIEVPDRPGPVAVADFDGDGMPEILVSSLTQSSLSIISIGKNRTFDEVRTFSVWPSGAPESENGGGVISAVADVDKDRVVDVLYAQTRESKLHVLRGLGGGNFSHPTSFISSARRSSAVDLDRSGFPDLVSSGTSSRNGIEVLYNDLRRFSVRVSIKRPGRKGSRERRSRWVTAATLFGSKEVDVREIQLESLKLGSAGLPLVPAQFRDVDGDGHLDVKLRFAAPPKPKASTRSVRCIEGRMTRGDRINGCDLRRQHFRSWGRALRFEKAGASK